MDASYKSVEKSNNDNESIAGTLRSKNMKKNLNKNIWFAIIKATQLS